MGASKKIWDFLLISAIVAANIFKFGMQLGFGEQRTKKQHLGPKLRIPNIFGTQLVFGEYVTVTTLVPNLVEAV